MKWNKVKDILPKESYSPLVVLTRTKEKNDGWEGYEFNRCGTGPYLLAIQIGYFVDGKWKLIQEPGSDHVVLYWLETPETPSDLDEQDYDLYEPYQINLTKKGKKYLCSHIVSYCKENYPNGFNENGIPLNIYVVKDYFNSIRAPAHYIKDGIVYCADGITNEAS